MENKAQLVSILMTSFNREKYIAEAIESVLASTFQAFELIILDDCSIDNTVAIAREYEVKDKRIRVYINDRNLGQFQNRNQAAKYATGKYLKYLDSDDRIEPWGLAYCVEAMKSFPEAGFGTFYPDENAEEQLEILPPEQSVVKHFFNKSFLSVGPTGTIIRRDAFQKVGGFDARFGVASDNYFNILMAVRYPVVLLPRLFVYYREHLGQEKNNPEGYLINNYNLLRELFESSILPLSEEQINFQRRKLDKRLSVNLVKHLAANRSLAATQKIFAATGFNFTKLIKSFSY